MNNIRRSPFTSIRLVIIGLFLLLGATWHSAISAPCPASLDHVELPERYDVEFMISRDRPEGVVFHIYEQEEDALEWVLPRIVLYTRWIHEVWPEIPVAVVTHGSEMLALASAETETYPQVHKYAQELAESDVMIHVCGTFSQTMGLSVEDFPRYIDVVPFGPAQIEDYRYLGYKVIDVELTW